MSRILLRGGRVIDPASDIDGPRRCAGHRRQHRGGRAAGPARSRRRCDGHRRDRMLGRAGTDRSARASARSRVSRRRKRSRPDFALRQPEASPRSPRWRTPRRSTTAPTSTRYMLDRAREVHATRLIPVSAVTKGLARRGDWSTLPRWSRPVRGFFPTTEFRSTTRRFWRARCDEIARLDFAISLHEEDRALTDNGAVNAGEVSKRLGVTGVSDVGRDRTHPARPRARDRHRGAGPYRASSRTARVARAGPRGARRAARSVTCEVTPHHFALDDRAVLRWGPNAKMNPPLRSRARRRGAARGDRRRHDRYDRDRSCSARSALQADGTAGRVVSPRERLRTAARGRWRSADAGRQRHRRTGNLARSGARTGASQ